MRGGEVDSYPVTPGDDRGVVAGQVGISDMIIEPFDPLTFDIAA